MPNSPVRITSPESKVVLPRPFAAVPLMLGIVRWCYGKEGLDGVTTAALAVLRHPRRSQPVNAGEQHQAGALASPREIDGTTGAKTDRAGLCA
jgi:hypothetical protein